MASRLAATLDLADRGLRVVEVALAAAAGAILAGTMLLVTADALSRHFFHAPISLAFNLTESYLMVSGIVLAFPWGYRVGGRIRIALLMTRFPRKVQAGLLRFGSILTLPYLVALVWLSSEKTIEAFASHEIRMGIINWSTGWSWIWVPIGLFFLTLRVLIEAFRPIDPVVLNELI